MASLLGAHETTAGTERHAFAVAPVAAISGGVVILLLVVSGRYGYHRDELYFLAAGHHLAWGYPDQPPLAPLLARVLSNLAPGSVSVLRVPSSLATGATVALGAASARELGADRWAQTLAAAVLASGGVVLGTGHLLSTATFDLLAWAVLVWLVLRLLRGADQRLWLVVGVVAGVGLLDSDLVAFLLIAIGVGLVLTGPRPVLRSPWLWIAALLAAVMWAPYLVWQAQHSWPELTVSRSIAAGHSGTS
ncbi:MAG TPA: glycosyltransferase family 39 protein, partial [Acidimicrobiales bacterium]|nr:glycosyltransferase family 39 protein [Acidimicrobiales bacterium]